LEKLFLAFWCGDETLKQGAHYWVFFLVVFPFLIETVHQVGKNFIRKDSGWKIILKDGANSFKDGDECPSLDPIQPLNQNLSNFLE
jgi:hypothetical protein